MTPPPESSDASPPAPDTPPADGPTPSGGLEHTDTASTGQQNATNEQDRLRANEQDRLRAFEAVHQRLMEDMLRNLTLRVRPEVLGLLIAMDDVDRPFTTPVNTARPSDRANTGGGSDDTSDDDDVPDLIDLTDSSDDDSVPTRAPRTAAPHTTKDVGTSVTKHTDH
ncbi:hypothetical protein EXIGLDRAFT_780292 [Exidia glandulosa HHB12029]|uniref:Uncharacterized protein n=1 Tax=Exidia glandulosa HHB12029 TaxID=1314781 RepID=A0A165BP53_EXIGL|nr:hypothetical protein EXIGLDRAFT_780292 [Exidia glandulosa HHB12029]